MGHGSYFNYTLLFALQLRKSRNTSVRIVGKVLGRVCSVDPAALLRAITTAPLISSLFRLRYRELVPCDFGQPPVGTDISHLAELTESLHQVTLTRNSQAVLWCQILVDLLVANVRTYHLYVSCCSKTTGLNHGQLPR